MDTTDTPTETGTSTATGTETGTGTATGTTARSGRQRRLAAGAAATAVLALAGACAADPPGTEAVLRTLAATVTAQPVTAPPVTTEAEADGEIPDGRTLTPSDTGSPAVGNLDGPLREALQQAAVDARAKGIEMTVTSGWRSKAYQQRLLDRGVVTYGSLEQARKFVNTPEKSAHVSGKAVDVGPTSADYWLIQNGARYGLCQVYANEIWHFELLTTPGGTCPAPLPDAAG